MTDFFEIIEFSNGDIGLRKAGDDLEEMIVTIRFSEDAKEGLKSHYVEVVHAMIEAGIHKVGELSGMDIEQENIITEAETPNIIH